MKLVVTVVEIQGRCPVYKPGDKFILQEGFILVTEASDNLCMHSLASIMPYYVALSHGVRPRDLGLAKGGGSEAYLQCLDPCDLTGGGTVRFAVSRVEDASN
jgi:uncharacterized repeat protein (TIGR04076 family)